MISPAAPRSHEEHCRVVVIGPCGLKPAFPKKTATSDRTRPQLPVIKTFLLAIILLAFLVPNSRLWLSRTTGGVATEALEFLSL